MLDEIRHQNDLLTQLLGFKNESDHYCTKTVDVIKIHFPLLEKLCTDLLELASLFTVQHGHSARLDFIKDTTFDVYGKTIGEKL